MARRRDRPYHHGDLRRALMDEALRAIAADGPALLNLRALSRALKVSHAAPLHHFPDKTALLTAIAAEGFTLLTEELGRAWAQTGDFFETGIAYVRFAASHRAHFEVMFRPELYRQDDPDLAGARDAASAVLYRAAGAASGEGDALRAGVAGWALMHGLVTLFLNGNLPPETGTDPEALAREVGASLAGLSRTRRARR